MLTITTAPGLASLWLIPRLAGFTGADPGVDVRTDASHELRSLVSDGYDPAIRYGRSGAMQGAPFFDEVVVPMCAPALLKRPGAPLKSPADLRRHTLLQPGSATGQGMPAEWMSWLAAVNAADLAPAALLTFNTYDTAIAAALADTRSSNTAASARQKEIHARSSAPRAGNTLPGPRTGG